MTAARRSGPADSPNLAADRVLQVLSGFLTSSEPMGVMEISRRLGLDKSVVHRILTTLTRHGYLDQDISSRKYRVGPTAWELGQRFTARSWVADVAVPLLDKLLRRFGSSGYVGSLDGAEIVYLATVDGPGPFQVWVDVGSRASALTTALGRAILAELPADELERVVAAAGPQVDRGRLEEELAAARSRGYAVNRGESRPGVGSVGAAIKNPKSRIVGAISVAFPIMPEFETMWEILPAEIMKVAGEISRQVG
jgi:DNA-binding IclR family transcriptional regulator